MENKNKEKSPENQYIDEMNKARKVNLDIENFTDDELKEEYLKIVREMQNRGFENENGCYC